eukprot:660475-Amphidinium_carterae.1
MAVESYLAKGTLRKYYRRHVPSKHHRIEEILDKGKEQILIRALEAKYGIKVGQKQKGGKEEPEVLKYR